MFSGVTLIAIAILFDGLAYNKTLKNTNHNPLKGIFISLIAGIAMGFFYKFVASSMSVDFLIPQAGKLTPYML